MRGAQAIPWPSTAEPVDSGLARWTTRLEARLRAGPLDRDLAAGIAPWRSRLHAARSLQLTGARTRRGLAGSLQRLLADTRRPPAPIRGAAVGPCRDQVWEAQDVLGLVVAQLLSAAPVDAGGVARLTALLSDGNGPCYVNTHPGALSSTLQEISQWLVIEA
jgi:hypothetical protein